MECVTNPLTTYTTSPTTEYVVYSGIDGFNQWCSEYSWLITLISIILSGLVSLVISKYYYDKSNRISAITSIVSEIYKILNKPKSREHLGEFRVLKDLYYMNFLKKNEQDCLRALYDSYEAVLDYDAISVASDAVVDLYHKVLSDNGVEIHIWPLEDEKGTIVDYDIPPSAEVELFQWIYNNLKAWDGYEIDSNTENKINSMLIRKTRDVFPDGTHITDYFAGTSFEEVVNLYEANHWGDRLNAYKLHREKFYSIFSDLNKH